MRRREFLATLPFLAGPIGGCVSKAIDTPIASVPIGSIPIIDAHCHVFNANDLPVEKFITVTRLHMDAAGPDGTRESSGLTDYVVKLFAHLAGAQHAPSACEEIAVLQNRAAAKLVFDDPVKAEEDTIRRTAKFLSASDGEDIPDEKALEELEPGTLKKEQQESGSQGAKQSKAEERVREVKTRDGAFSRLLSWISLFKVYRHVNVEHLAADLKRQGFTPVLLTPAIIDYSRWLLQEPNSPLTDQIAVMGEIARQKELPAVHGYIAYDPLRALCERNDVPRIDGTLEPVAPIEIVRKALDEHGFMGVKLYPPMGFRAWNNTELKQDKDFPDHAVGQLRKVRPDLALGAELDQSLREIYTYCSENGVPILSHCAQSNGRSERYETRADPTYWLQAVTEFPKLRVCLAHFGRFGYRSYKYRQPNRDDEDRRRSEIYPDETWEWVIGTILRKVPEPQVYADISFFSEVLSLSEKDRAALSWKLKRFISFYDPEVRHLVFGTDWVMTGIVRKYNDYATLITRFLEKDCGLTPEQMERVLYRNAQRFMGLEEGEKSLQRMRDFYRINNMAEKPFLPRPAA
jgi:predicted TIM-barrel fold metal-dependent hydrolase